MVERRALYLVALCAGCDVAYPNVEMDRTPRVAVVLPVEPGGHHERVVLSTVQADADVWVSPMRSGRVVETRVAVGDRVARGDTLAVFDAREARSNVKLAEAAVSDAVIARDDARAQLGRVEKLGDGASAAQLQSAQTAVARTQAAVARAVAQRELARTELSHMTLSAPVPGVVSAVEIEVGETAAAGSPAVRIVEPAEVHVEVGLTADEVAVVNQEGARFLVRRDAQQSTATLRNVAVAADPRTLTWTAELALTESSFAVGAPVEVVLSLPSPTRGVALPPSTVYEGQVWVVVDGVADRRAVEIVGEGTEGLYVTGVEASEAVVAHGSVALEAGQAVVVLEAAP